MNAELIRIVDNIAKDKGIDRTVLVKALEEAANGIRVTNIYPGEVNTPLLDQRPELSDQPFMTREETSKYTETIRDGKVQIVRHGDDFTAPIACRRAV